MVSSVSGWSSPRDRRCARPSSAPSAYRIGETSRPVPDSVAVSGRVEERIRGREDRNLCLYSGNGWYDRSRDKDLAEPLVGGRGIRTGLPQRRHRRNQRTHRALTSCAHIRQVSVAASRSSCGRHAARKIATARTRYGLGVRWHGRTYYGDRRSGRTTGQARARGDRRRGLRAAAPEPDRLRAARASPCIAAAPRNRDRSRRDEGWFSSNTTRSRDHRLSVQDREDDVLESMTRPASASIARAIIRSSRGTRESARSPAERDQI